MSELINFRVQPLASRPRTKPLIYFSPGLSAVWVSKNKGKRWNRSSDYRRRAVLNRLKQATLWPRYCGSHGKVKSNNDCSAYDTAQYSSEVNRSTVRKWQDRTQNDCGTTEEQKEGNRDLQTYESLEYTIHCHQKPQTERIRHRPGAVSGHSQPVMLSQKQLS